MLSQILTALFMTTICFFLFQTIRFYRFFTDIGTDLFHHFHTATLTRQIIGSVITSLHNGEDLRPYTLQKAIEVIQNRLTDALLENSYDLKHWGCKALVLSCLGDSELLVEIEAALEKRRDEESCPD